MEIVITEYDRITTRLKNVVEFTKYEGMLGDEIKITQRIPIKNLRNLYIINKGETNGIQKTNRKQKSR